MSSAKVHDRSATTCRTVRYQSYLACQWSQTQSCVLFRQQGAAPGRWSWLTGEVVGLLLVEAEACCRLRAPAFLPTQHVHVGDRMAREEHRDAWRRQPPVRAIDAERDGV